MNILCVCQANMGRSPMMEAFLDSLTPETISVESAGVKERIAKENNPASPEAVYCMQEKGFDISDHTSRWVGNVNVPEFDLLVVVGKKEKKEVERLFGADTPEIALLNSSGGGISDPHKEGLVSYREKRDLIENSIKELVNSLDLA